MCSMKENVSESNRETFCPYFLETGGPTLLLTHYGVDTLGPIF